MSKGNVIIMQIYDFFESIIKGLRMVRLDAQNPPL